jgi:hypothetical protein
MRVRIPPFGQIKLVLHPTDIINTLLRLCMGAGVGRKTRGEGKSGRVNWPLISQIWYYRGFGGSPVPSQIRVPTELKCLSGRHLRIPAWTR